MNTAINKVPKVELYKEKKGIEQHTITVYTLTNSVDILFYNDEDYGTIITVPIKQFLELPGGDLRQKIKQVLTSLINQI